MSFQDAVHWSITGIGIFIIMILIGNVHLQNPESAFQQILFILFSGGISIICFIIAIYETRKDEVAN